MFDDLLVSYCDTKCKGLPYALNKHTITFKPEPVQSELTSTCTPCPLTTGAFEKKFTLKRTEVEAAEADQMSLLLISLGWW